MEAYRQIQTQDWELNQVQQNTARSFNPLLQIALLDGVLMSNVVVNTTDTTFEHGLGRAPLGFIIAGKQGLGDIYQTASSELSIILKSSVQVTASIWVY